MRKLRVYVAGSYSASNVITVLDNMRKGLRLSTEVFLAGYAPFSPWLDYQFALMLREGEVLKVEDYYSYSMSWLEASDCILLVPGWEESKGTLKEIERAKELRLPVFNSLKEVKEWMDKKPDYKE